MRWLVAFIVCVLLGHKHMEEVMAQNSKPTNPVPEANSNKKPEAIEDASIQTEGDKLQQKQESVAENVNNNELHELTPTQRKAEELFSQGEALINSTFVKKYDEALLLFEQAAQLNHSKAQEYVSFAYLFGDHLPHNITHAHELLEKLAAEGSPKAQMGLGFMHSQGINLNSSQGKSLVYQTFAALGGEPMAQMALGYRYYAGIGVEMKCETALTYYKKVATTVADAVTPAGGIVVQRIRLQDELENQGNNSPLLDEDLLQYYHFLADKGDTQAQNGKEEHTSNSS